MIIAGALVLVLVALLAWAWITYNRMIRTQNQVDGSWAQIDVQLERRHDLIPNLIESVRGYAAHERSTFDSVTEARMNAHAATGPAQRAAAEQSLSRSLRTLFAVAEAYPDLRADQSFAALQTELAATENLIAESRSAYNDAVLAFNTMTQRVPMNLLSHTMRLSQREYFEAGDPPLDGGPAEVQFGAG